MDTWYHTLSGMDVGRNSVLCEDGLPRWATIHKLKGNYFALSEQPHDDLGTNFKRCLEFRNAKASLLKKYGDKFDFIELGKLAIDYSDGIVQTSENVNANLMKYAVESKN